MLDLRRTVMVITAAIVVGIPATVLAQTEVDWTASDPLTGEVVDGELVLDIGGAGLHPLLIIDQPGVQPPSFQLDGTVRHEEVVGAAYFEMWTVLPDGSRYFTRTLADAGPLAYMTGSSEQRPFSMPFELGEGGPVPSRLEINLVTEGPGRFWVGPLTILSAAGQPLNTTTSTQAATSTTSEVEPSTTAPPAASGTTIPGGAEQTEGTVLWWGLGAFLVVAAVSGLWATSIRRRRAEEERRMNAIDSLRP